MVSIRFGTVDDVPLLKTLIQEFATFERLSTAITEGQLRRDGFGGPSRNFAYSLRRLIVCQQATHSSSISIPIDAITTPASRRPE